MRKLIITLQLALVLLITLSSCAQPQRESDSVPGDGAANSNPLPAEVVDFEKDYAEYFQPDGRMEHHVFRHFGHAFFNGEINSNRITAKFVADPIRYSFVGDAVDPLQLKTELFIDEVAKTINYGFEHVNADTPIIAGERSDVFIMVVDADEWENYYTVYNRFLNELLDNRLGTQKVDLDALTPHGARCVALSIKRRGAFQLKASWRLEAL